MFTVAFWRAAAERMLKGAATGLVLSGVSAEPFDLFHWNWKVGLGYALGGALASLVWSILSVPVGPAGSPSLVRDPAAAGLPAAATLTGSSLPPSTRTNGGTGTNMRVVDPVKRADVQQAFYAEKDERIVQPKQGGYRGGDVTPPD